MTKVPVLVFTATSISIVKALRIRRSVVSILPLFPIGYLLVFILWFCVDVPFWDEWDFVPVVGQVYQGTWSIWDIWKPHNEHRLVFPKLVLLTLAWISGWNKLYELLANFLLAVGTFFVLSRCASRTLRSITTEKLQWLPGVISLQVFSLNQFENWFWGFQLCGAFSTSSLSLPAMVSSRKPLPVGAVSLGPLGSHHSHVLIFQWLTILAHCSAHALSLYRC